MPCSDRRAKALHLNQRLAWLVALAAAIGISHQAAGQLASKPADQWIKTLDSSNRVAKLKIDQTITVNIPPLSTLMFKSIS